ncbi:hypothetical protein A2U01_0054072, partial [Trifolium medium]|nr:hypothetical protein [Trifolium medium]
MLEFCSAACVGLFKSFQYSERGGVNCGASLQSSAVLAAGRPEVGAVQQLLVQQADYDCNIDASFNR